MSCILQTIDLPRRCFTANSINWIGGNPPPELLSSDGIHLAMKLRHGPNLSYGHIRRITSFTHDGTNEDITDAEQLLEVRLDKVDKGIAPGQFVAFYQRKVYENEGHGPGEGFICLGAAVVASIQEDSFHVERSSGQNDFADVSIKPLEVREEEVFELLG